MMFLVMMVVMVWSKGQIYHVGDLYTTPNGTQGIVFYVRPDGGGWAVALHDEENLLRALTDRGNPVRVTVDIDQNTVIRHGICT